jgi:hypothetical protein
MRNLLEAHQKFGIVELSQRIEKELSSDHLGMILVLRLHQSSLIGNLSYG